MHALYMDPAVAVQPTLQWHLVFKPHASFNSPKEDINAYLWTPSTHQETKDKLLTQTHTHTHTHTRARHNQASDSESECGGGSSALDHRGMGEEGWGQHSSGGDQGWAE